MIKHKQHRGTPYLKENELKHDGSENFIVIFATVCTSIIRNNWSAEDTGLRFRGRIKRKAKLHN